MKLLKSNDELRHVRIYDDRHIDVYENKCLRLSIQTFGKEFYPQQFISDFIENGWGDWSIEDFMKYNTLNLIYISMYGKYMISYLHATNDDGAMSANWKLNAKLGLSLSIDDDNNFDIFIPSNMPIKKCLALNDMNDIFNCAGSDDISFRRNYDGMVLLSCETYSVVISQELVEGVICTENYFKNVIVCDMANMQYSSFHENHFSSIKSIVTLNPEQQAIVGKALFIGYKVLFWVKELNPDGTFSGSYLICDDEYVDIISFDVSNEQALLGFDWTEI